MGLAHMAFRVWGSTVRSGRSLRRQPDSDLPDPHDRRSARPDRGPPVRGASQPEPRPVFPGLGTESDPAVVPRYTMRTTPVTMVGSTPRGNRGDRSLVAA
jgi:hypothetical protein